MCNPRNPVSKCLPALALLAGCTRPVAPDLGLVPTVQRPADGLCVSLLLDTLVDAVTTDLGGELIAMLGYGVPWATSVPDADIFYPPDDPNDLATYAAAATRYGDRVHTWEIWNEPNAGFRFWKQDPFSIGGDPQGYADLFVAAADAIHAADPSARVLLGGVFFHSQGYTGGVEFLQQVVDARPEVLEKADAVSFHTYTLYPPRRPPEADTDGEVSLSEMIAQIRAVTGDLPVVITEAGWPSFDTVDEDTQAAWLVREYALAHTSGLQDVCWYTLEDSTDPQANPERAFGLMRQGATEDKPSGVAYRALAGALSQVGTGYGHAEAALDLPYGVTAIRYAGDRTLTAVWSTGDPADVALPPVERGCGPVPVHATGTPSLVVQGGGCEGR